MWDQKEIDRVIEIAFQQVGKPYRWGGKPRFTDPNPVDMDCSGFVRYVIAQGRDTEGRKIFLPEGSFQQIKACRPLLVEPWRPLDIGFSNHDSDPEPEHVILRVDSSRVIEARGCSKHKGHDPEDCPYGKVIIKPVAVWEAFPGFLGWFRAAGIHDKEGVRS